MNPLFATDDTNHKQPKNDNGYVLPNRHGRKINPLHDNIQPETAHPATAHNSAAAKHDSRHPGQSAAGEANPAVELIRRKLENLYAMEPDAHQEEATAAGQPEAGRSKHQQFMHDLSTSGKSLAEIQTAWHDYYIKLPDAEKHAVWQEFYTANTRQPAFAAQSPRAAQPHEGTKVVVGHGHTPLEPTVLAPSAPAFPGLRHATTPKAAEPKPVIAGYAQHSPKPRKPERRSTAAIKRHIKKRVRLSADNQAKAMQHAKSLLFGLSSGAVVLLVVLFGLFNEVVLAPFIQPSRTASATPIILGTDSVAPSATPEVIIPKISVQIPVDYDLDTTEETAFQKALESAVVHYNTTPKPGEKGNTAIFGHSSNNIFNPGKYKFAFVKLHELVPGDIFYLTSNGKVYSYRVYDKRIVPPTDVSVLDAVPDKTATAALITCDPPGTSLNRLVVWGEQISPDPNANTEAAPAEDSTQPAEITGNGPSLWRRIADWFQ